MAARRRPHRKNLSEKHQGMYGAVWRVPGRAELQGEDKGRVGMVVDVASWPEKLAGAPSAAARFAGAVSIYDDASIRSW